MMNNDKDKMVDNITIQYLENGIFEETTVYRDGSSIIETFDHHGILISRRMLNGSPKLQKMLKEIKKNNLDYKEPDNKEEPDNKKAEDILALIRARQQQCTEESNARVWIQRLIDQNK